MTPVTCGILWRKHDKGKRINLIWISVICQIFDACKGTLKRGQTQDVSRYVGRMNLTHHPAFNTQAFKSPEKP
jgi:hypothetical protein